ncbi:conserved membrane hypothetical protein [Candidatus Zixiibacteriota bacterium]|nr:conserved membrane hypothetical protein [candidate division Zixibacteria bacterium]
MKFKIMILGCLLLALALPAVAQDSTGTTEATIAPSISPPAPVTDATAKDSPNDNGHSITLRWTPSADDGAGQKSVLGYKFLRSFFPDSGFVLLKDALAPSGSSEYIDNGGRKPEEPKFMPNDTNYYYIIRTITADSNVYADSPVIGPVQAKGQLYNVGRTLVLVFVLCFAIITFFFIRKARGGANLFVRRLAGIEAVDEAIGRATEMGKPILYVLGLGTAADIATIASFTILGRVAKKVAEYQTGLIVPCYDAIVMTVAQETVRTAYLDAGRPDAYNDDMVYYVTSNQFAYVAAVNGTMLRQLPATNIYMGTFYAESLLLAETGALAGSVQISGTDQVAQIPFFVVACDYTLIGEELYAASAYLSREPILLGSLKAQDYGKAAIIIISILGIIAAQFHWSWFLELFRAGN